MGETGRGSASVAKELTSMNELTSMRAYEDMLENPFLQTGM